MKIEIDDIKENLITKVNPELNKTAEAILWQEINNTKVATG